MRKWIGGCLVVCVVVIGMGLWSAYRKLAPFSGANGAETVMIAAPVTRVFASLANADSLSGWMAERQAIKVAHHGMLVPGDTLQIDMRNRFNFGPRPSKWTVSEVRQNQLLVLVRSDTSDNMVARRQFTLAAKGESTLVLSAVAAPRLDSTRAKRGDTLKASDLYLDAASKFLISAVRMQAHVELEQLKAHVEGHSSPGAQR